MKIKRIIALALSAFYENKQYLKFDMAGAFASAFLICFSGDAVAFFIDFISVL